MNGDETYATLPDLLVGLGRRTRTNPTGDLEDWLETRLWHDVDLNTLGWLTDDDGVERVDLWSDTGELPSIVFPLALSALDEWLQVADALLANGRLIAALKEWDCDEDEDGDGADQELIVETVAGVLSMAPARLVQDLSEDGWEVLDEHGVVGHSVAPDVLVSWKKRVVLGLSPGYLSVHSTHWHGPDLVVDDGYGPAFVGEWALTGPDREPAYRTVIAAMHEALRSARPRPLPRRNR